MTNNTPWSGLGSQLGNQLLDELLRWAREEPAWREPLREFALTLLDAVEGKEEPEAESEVTPSLPVHPELAPAVQAEPLRDRPLDYSSLLSPQPAPVPAPPVVHHVEYTPNRDDLRLIACRAQLKAETVRAILNRQITPGGHRAGTPTTPNPVYSGLISEAKQLENCFLWMLKGMVPYHLTPARLEAIIASYDRLAEAALLLDLLLDQPECSRDRLTILLQDCAEAQAILRVELEDWLFDMDMKFDHDQKQMHEWLRYFGETYQIYIQKYMRWQDAPDPTRGPKVSLLLREHREQLEYSQKLQKLATKHLHNLARKAEWIATGQVSPEDEWPRMLELIDALGQVGLKPSDKQLRKALAPAWPSHPRTGSPFWMQVQESIDLAFEGIHEDDEDLVSQLEIPTAEVEQVAQWLEGRDLVIIGGQKRPHAVQALRDAFRLRHVEWVTTVDHESPTVFRAPVSQPNVAAVLLLIRFSNHNYANVKTYCDEFGKPLIRIPRGYSPNQVAYEILSQASEQLKSV